MREEAVHPAPGEAIAVVGYGAVLPDAADADAFWSNLHRGRCSIRELPEERWSGALYCGMSGSGGERCDSHTAGFVDDATVGTLARSLGMSLQRHTRLEVMTLEAARQAVAALPPSLLGAVRVDSYLGCTEVDERVGRRKFVAANLASLEDHVRETCRASAADLLERIHRRLEGWEVDPETHRHELLTASVLPLLQRRLGFAGEGALIDAACASSLAAVEVAVRALQSGSADLVLAGGIEGNLGPDTFALFSRLGALASDRCLPLDHRTTGLSQGEGAVVFALERLEVARREGHPVHAVVAGWGASSDGTSASLFEPTSEGQLRALAQAYRGVDPAEVDFVECHATGTRVGDETELRSVRRFFGRRRLPVGSVKALVGHTKGAAGAVSMLKGLLALRHREVPPSPYFREPIVRDGGDGGPYVNPVPVALRRRRRPLTCGVSSFGFGGINYHVVLREPLEPRREGRSLAGASRGSASPPGGAGDGTRVVLVTQHWRPTAGVRQADGLRVLRIPPRSLPQIDELQLAALLAVVGAAAAANLDLRRLDGSAVSIIAASTVGLEAAAQLSLRVRHAEIVAALEGCDESVVERVLSHRERYPAVTEDTGPGVLNNVVAGRVANHFDFTGPSFNVDAELASPAVALRLAAQRLADQGGLVVLLAADERFDAPRFAVHRRGVTCRLLTTVAFAHAHGLPIQAALEGVRRLAPDDSGGRADGTP